jgi:hypothetical protein
LLDKKLKPYLLEVNHSPSFTTDGTLDKLIKRRVIFDTLKILNVSARERRRHDTASQKATVRRITGTSSQPAIDSTVPSQIETVLGGFK